MMMSKCPDCNHRHICKYQEEYEKLLKNIVVTVPEPFTLTLNCNHYYSTNCYLNGAGYSDSTSVWSNSLNESCPRGGLESAY